MSRTARHQAILELVKDESFKSQDELAHALADRGYAVTQSTLSRDLAVLRIVRTQKGYATLNPPEADEPLVPTPARTMATFVTGAEAAQNIAVIRTAPGAASAVAKALDTLELDGIVGTVAGDDTVIVVAKTTASALALARKVLEMIGRGGSNGGNNNGKARRRRR